jgi:hypothetical protein
MTLQPYSKRQYTTPQEHDQNWIKTVNEEFKWKKYNLYFVTN